MGNLNQYLDQQLIRGQAYFNKKEAVKTLGLGTRAFTDAATRLIKKHQLVSPWRGFYLILRPEDRVTGVPDPVQWIGPLMKYLKLDYRISLLRAASFHGSSHQAAMVFQVIVPKQLRSFEIGRHRIQFIYQMPGIFSKTNSPGGLQQLKSEAGFAKVAGIELTLLDSARYFHETGGINGLAQIVYDLGGNAHAHKLAKVAAHYENSSVRRLGYLLERFGHKQQANALIQFAAKAKSIKPLDPAAKRLTKKIAGIQKKDSKWLLMINHSVEVD